MTRTDRGADHEEKTSTGEWMKGNGVMQVGQGKRAVALG